MFEGLVQRLEQETRHGLDHVPTGTSDDPIAKLCDRNESLFFSYEASLSPEARHRRAVRSGRESVHRA